MPVQRNGDAQAWSKAIRSCLRQAIVNLRGERSCVLAAGRRSMSTSRRARRVACPVRVIDRGPGVPDYALPRVFERFYSLPRPEGGSRSSGLGLCFVAEVAALHGGVATLANSPAARRDRHAAPARRPDFTVATPSAIGAARARREAARIPRPGRTCHAPRLQSVSSFSSSRSALLIPLMLIHGDHQEREAYREQAVADVAAQLRRQAGRAGAGAGRALCRTVEVEEAEPQGARKVLRDAGGQVDVLSRHAGGRRHDDARHAQARVVSRAACTNCGMHARAAIARAASPPTARARAASASPYLSVGVSDVRGFVGTPTLSIDGRQALPLQAGFGSRRPSAACMRDWTRRSAGEALALDLRFDASDRRHRSRSRSCRSRKRQPFRADVDLAAIRASAAASCRARAPSMRTGFTRAAGRSRRWRPARRRQFLDEGPGEPAELARCAARTPRRRASTRWA